MQKMALLVILGNVIDFHDLRDNLRADVLDTYHSLRK